MINTEKRLTVSKMASRTAPEKCLKAWVVGSAGRGGRFCSTSAGKRPPSKIRCSGCGKTALRRSRPFLLHVCGETASERSCGPPWGRPRRSTFEPQLWGNGLRQSRQNGLWRPRGAGNWSAPGRSFCTTSAGIRPSSGAKFPCWRDPQDQLKIVAVF